MPPVDLNTRSQWQTWEKLTGELADRRFKATVEWANYHAGNHPGISRSGQFMPVEIFRKVLENLQFDPAIARLTQVSRASRFIVFSEAGHIFQDTHKFLAASRRCAKKLKPIMERKGLSFLAPNPWDAAVGFQSNAVPVKSTDLELIRRRKFGDTDLMKKYIVKFETNPDPLFTWDSLNKDDKKSFFIMLDKINYNNINIIKPFASCVGKLNFDDRENFGYRSINKKQDKSYITSVVIEMQEGFLRLMHNHRTNLLSSICGGELYTEKGLSFRNLLLTRGKDIDLKALIAGTVNSSTSIHTNQPITMGRTESIFYLQGALEGEQPVKIASAVRALGEDFWKLPKERINNVFECLKHSLRNDSELDFDEIPHRDLIQTLTLRLMLKSLNVAQQPNLDIEDLRHCAELALIVKANEWN